MTDFERHEYLGKRLYNTIIATLRENADYCEAPGFYANADSILECDHETDAYAMADLLNSCGYLDAGVEYNETTMLYEIY